MNIVPFFITDSQPPIEEQPTVRGLHKPAKDAQPAPMPGVLAGDDGNDPAP